MAAGTKTAQLGRPERAGVKAFVKKMTRRLRRRAERALLDEAPVRNGYRGYTN